MTLEMVFGISADARNHAGVEVLVNTGDPTDSGNPVRLMILLYRKILQMLEIPLILEILLLLGSCCCCGSCRCRLSCY